MEELDKLIESQANLHESIQKLITNFKKEKTAIRKTEEYLKKKTTELNDLWRNYIHNNEKISTYTDDANYYEIKVKFDETKHLVESAKQLIKQTSMIEDNNKQFNQNQSDTQTSVNNDEKIKRIFRYKKLEMINLLKKLMDMGFQEHSATYYVENIKYIENKWNSLSTSYDEVLGLFKEDEIIKELEDFNDLTNKYLNSLVELNSSNSTNLNENDDECNRNVKKSNQTKIKLPKIDIPKFNGEYVKWREFSDLYCQLIHENVDLSEIEKFQYLKSNLMGEAIEPIRHLTMITENYNKAWELLRARFENNRIIVSRHLECLIYQPNIKTENYKSIKKLHDTTKECLYGLNNSGIDTNTWDSIVLFILTSKLDKESNKLYEQSLINPKKVQSLNNFLNFLEKRYQVLESISNKKDNISEIRESSSKGISHQNFVQSFGNGKMICTMCNLEHLLTNCPKFNKMAVPDRVKFVKQNKFCFNCLNPKHFITECKSRFNCLKCKKRHHSLLHYNEGTKNYEQKIKQSEASEDKNKVNSEAPSVKAMTCKYDSGEVLLATAVISVKNNLNKVINLRALVDQGAMASFISEAAAKKLNLKRFKANKSIRGIGAANAGITRSTVNLEIIPLNPDMLPITIKAYTLEKLADNIPESHIEGVNCAEWGDIKLADPNYLKSGPIDVILGVDVYTKIIEDGLIKNQSGLVAQRTQLGWIIFGQTFMNNRISQIRAMITNFELNQKFENYIEQEEIEDERFKTEEEVYSERMYEENVQRSEDGRYIVPLLFKPNHPMLGKSRELAIARLIQLEKKMEKNSSFATDYRNCITEYLSLGHMKECSQNDDLVEEKFYLPHHAVFKESSTTTKMRIVFDGSAKTSSGVSLNEIFLTGPKLQQSLFHILIRWRKHKIVLTADIEKMYRQITVNEKFQNYQRIVWRNNKQDPIKDFKLTTVTFGTTCAPYLAIKTIQQLANDNMSQSPEVAKIILRDFYVDDLLTGCDDDEMAGKLMQQLQQILESGGFPLRKWNSNSKKILQNSYSSEATVTINNVISTLGIFWNPDRDSFKIKTDFPAESESSTKRSFLSDIFKIFDPLGWLAPSTIKTKLLLQELWTQGLGWDEPIPKQISETWMQFKAELKELEKIEIPRWNGYTNSSVIQIHGFADASEKAYSAVVYSRIVSENGDVEITLLAAKTKVAPIKKVNSLPRLELCGAVLLSKLIKQIVKALEVQNIEIFAWTDSEIVLAWMNGRPNRWKTFVANRLSEIRVALPKVEWDHVKSRQNPADCASRGLFPRELVEFSLWWKGPDWLAEHESSWPKKNKDLVTNEEEKTDKIKVFETTQTEEIFKRFSSLRMLIRVIAYCRRFVENTKIERGLRITTFLRTDELKSAQNVIIKRVQAECFQNEILRLTKGLHLEASNKLLSLNLFIDKEGILRVGGRLQHSNLIFNKKHQILMPNNHHVSSLIINKAHVSTLHGGHQLTINYIRDMYWIINVKEYVKRLIHQCITCTKHSRISHTQIMAELPAIRVTPAPPFTRTGIDYAGPFQTRMSKGRGTKSYKGYMCIFVCLVTKAVHLEYVSDLTTEAFIAAYKRFTGRRGKCLEIYSDNGTNFVGANNQITSQYRQVINEATEITKNLLSNDGTTWKFIPASAPHFGGIWEAGVKSVKGHLKRVLGETTLTYEEFSTVLCQVEACLNSRPLYALSNDPNDFEVLTPGHFLIGRPLVAHPEPQSDEKNLHVRWKLVTKLTQDIWKRWHKEYLNSLQQRAKWKSDTKLKIEIGDLVYLKEDNIPPTKWVLGRIFATHPGTDNHVRVVTVKTNGKLLKRPITKLCILPVNNREGDQQTQEQTKPQSNVQVLHSSINKNENVSRPCQKTSLRTKWKFWQIFFLMFTISRSMSTKGEEIYKQTTFEFQSGLYFEGIGNVNMVETYWQILAFIDLKEYQQNMISSQNCVNLLRESLNIKIDAKYNNTGIVLLQKNMLVLLEHQVKDIKNNDLVLRPQQTYHRRKRGLVNLIGNVANELFGVLDQRDATHYEAELVKLKNDQKYLHVLLKNQTSISSLTINALMKEEASIRSKLNEITTHFNGVYDNIDDVSKLQYINTVFQYCTSITSNLKSIQDKILNIMLHSQQGNVHPSIFDPKQLQMELERIHSKIPKGMFLPSENQSRDKFNIYKTMTARMGLSQNNIIIEIKIPIISNEVFQLFNLIPVPVYHNNQFTYIKPKTNYLAVTLSREHYVLFSENYFKNCYSYQDNHMLCHNKGPVFTTVASNNQCEIEILKHSKEIPKSCEIRSVQLKRFWSPMVAKNSWIFSVKLQRTIDVICQENIQSVQLHNSGILKIKGGCHIKDDDITIAAESEVKTKFNISFLPTHNLSAFILQEKRKPQLTTYDHHDQSFRDDINRIQQLINQQGTSEIIDDHVNMHDVHHYTVIYLIVLIIAAAICLKAVQQCRKRKLRISTNV